LPRGIYKVTLRAIVGDPQEKVDFGGVRILP
jgi:hypothetical protein